MILNFHNETEENNCIYILKAESGENKLGK